MSYVTRPDYAQGTRMLDVVVFDVNRQGDISFAVYEDTPGEYSSIMIPRCILMRVGIPEFRIGLSIRLETCNAVDCKQKRIFIKHAETDGGLVRGNVLEGRFRFEDAYVEKVEKGMSLVDILARSELDPANHKSIYVSEGYFERRTDAALVAPRSIIRCVPVKPTDEEITKGHTRFRGAFPRIPR